MDYFSLNTKGSELEILATIPFDVVQIDVISVNVAHSNRTAVTELLTRFSYTVLKYQGLDVIFNKTMF